MLVLRFKNNLSNLYKKYIYIFFSFNKKNTYKIAK
jgi:hypothetical protein